MGTAVACAVAAPGVALAAPRDFRIAARPLAEALIDFAVQADVSIDTAAARRCRRMGNAVSGRLEPEAALRRLLADTGCGFEKLGPRNWRIVRLTETRPAPPPPSPPALPPPDPRPTEVEGVIVTATRRPSVAARLPYAVSTVPGDALAGQGATGAAEIALLTPGLTVTNLGPGRNKLIVRGLSDGGLTGEIQSTVGIYLDDTRLTYSAPDPDLRLVDVARVEVLRGPQGSLYGAGSIGGVLHIVTRRPDPTAWDGFVSAEVSTTAEGGPGHALEAMINAPLFDGRAAVRAVGWIEAEGGYLDNPLLGRTDVNATERDGGRLTLAADFGARWNVAAGLVGQTITSEDSQYVQAGLPDLTRITRVAEPHHNDFGASWLTLTGDLGFGRLRWNTAYVNHRLSSRYDASTALPDFGFPAGPAAAWDERLATGSWLSELDVTSPPGARIAWIGGVFLAEGHESQTYHLRSGGDLYSELRRDEISELSVYGEASLPWWRFTFTAGGRYFWASTETISDIEQSGAGTAHFSDEFAESGFAPKLVVRYQIDDRWMVYLQAAEGYRTGGFNTGGPIGQVFGSGPGQQPSRRYAGDELWSYEAGTKWSHLGLGLTLQASAYMVSWEDIQSTQLLPSGVPYTANIGAGEAFGLELEAAWRIGDFQFTGAAVVAEPELDEPAPGFVVHPDSALAGVARTTLSLTGQYRREWRDGWIVTAGARVAYIGRSQLTFDGGTSPDMGGYVTARIEGGVEHGHWRLEGFIENPADSRDNTFAYGNPFTLRSLEQITPQRPLTLGAQIRWRY